MAEFELSNHAARRQQSRAIPPEAIAFGARFGTIKIGKGMHGGGTVRRISWEQVKAFPERHDWEGVIVVVGKNGVIVTAFRDHYKASRPGRDPNAQKMSKYEKSTFKGFRAAFRKLRSTRESEPI